MTVDCDLADEELLLCDDLFVVVDETEDFEPEGTVDWNGKLDFGGGGEDFRVELEAKVFFGATGVVGDLVLLGLNEVDLLGFDVGTEEEDNLEDLLGKVFFDGGVVVEGLETAGTVD